MDFPQTFIIIITSIIPITIYGLLVFSITIEKGHGTVSFFNCIIMLFYNSGNWVDAKNALSSLKAEKK